MKAERRLLVDHATVHRWTLKDRPVLAKVLRRRKHPMGRAWHVDETCVKVAGEWKYLCRAFDKFDQTVDFLPTVRRGASSRGAIDQHGVPESITIDKVGVDTAAARGPLADSALGHRARQSKYVDNVVEQDHHAVKRRVRPMLGFKTFESARKLIAGIETMHMIKKGLMHRPDGFAVFAADYWIALSTTPRPCGALQSSYPGCCPVQWWMQSVLSGAMRTQKRR